MFSPLVAQCTDGAVAACVAGINTNFTLISATVSSANGTHIPTGESGTGYGYDMASLGDVDGDGVPDIAVGHPFLNNTGAVFVQFMNADGSVRNAVVTPADMPGCATLPQNAQFGFSLDAIDDADGNGVNDLVVGAIDAGVSAGGAVYVLFLDTQGRVVRCTEISDGVNGGPVQTSGGDEQFGHSVAFLGTLGSSGIGFIAVGDIETDDGVNIGCGGVYVYDLEANGTATILSVTYGERAGDQLGYRMAVLDDYDGNGRRELLVSAMSMLTQNDTLHVGMGRVLSFDATWGDAYVYSVLNISTQVLAQLSEFGFAVGTVPDMDGNGFKEVILTDYDNERFLVLYMTEHGFIERVVDTKADVDMILDTKFYSYSQFGISVASVGDMDDNGVNDVAIGIYSASDGVNIIDVGAMAIFFVASERRACGLSSANFDTLVAINATRSSLHSGHVQITQPLVLCDNDVQCRQQCICANSHQTAFCLL